MGRTRQRPDSAEWALCSAIDKLDEVDRYEAGILPLLRRTAKEQWSSSRIREELASFSQALVIQQALVGNINRSSQVAAIQDVLDRHEGKSRMRKAKSEHTVTRDEVIAVLRKKLYGSDE